MPFTAQKNIFKQLEEYADSHHLNKDEWEAYENSLWIARDQMAYMAAYEREAREKGLAEGRAEGRAEGMAKGIAKGMAKGKADERKAIALRLLDMGLSVQQVAQASGLCEADVEALSK